MGGFANPRPVERPALIADRMFAAGRQRGYCRRVFPGNSRANSTRQRWRRWWPWLVLSAILHLPLTPLGPLFGLLSLLIHMQAGIPDEPVEELVGIPIELLRAAAPPDESPAATAAAEDAVVLTPPKPKPEKKPKLEASDAGLPDAAIEDASVDASVDAGTPDASTLVDAGMGAADAGVLVGLGDAGTIRDDAGAGDAGAPKPDPFALAGELGRFQKGNVNVRVHLFVDELKRHPASGVIANLLGREPQWQQFLGPSGLDPLNDFSKIVIMGPQLVDSSQVGIFVEYRAEASAIRKAVDALVQRTEGARWETKNKKPVALVHAAGGDRVIILYPNHGIAIVPPKPAEQLIKLGKFPTLASPTTEREILQVMLKTPHRVRAFKRVGVEVPKSVSMARIFVGGTANGGATVRLELDDESPDAAATHAPDLERAMAKVTMGLFSLRLNAEGAQIRGEAQLSPLIVAGVLREVQKRLLPTPPAN